MEFPTSNALPVHSSQPPTSSRTGTFYFAFGSNLSASQMSRRLHRSPSSSVPVALARLDGYKWIICERGYANVVYAPSSRTESTGGQSGEARGAREDYERCVREGIDDVNENVVWGIIYNMHADDEATLDRYEGHDEYRNPEPEVNPISEERRWKPFLQGGWDYNKFYLKLRVTKWFRDPGEYGVEVRGTREEGSGGGGGDVVTALVYVDEHRLEDGVINAEYVGRMNRGIREAMALGLPGSWVERVMRRWIPEGVEVDDEGYVGTDRGYVPTEQTETLDDVKRRVSRCDGG